MPQFFDTLRVQVTPEGTVFAVRSNENRVDEYTLPTERFWELHTAYSEGGEGWLGPDDLQVMIDRDDQIISIAVRVGATKREIYRFGISHFDVLLAKFRAEAGGV